MKLKDAATLADASSICSELAGAGGRFNGQCNTPASAVGHRASEGTRDSRQQACTCVFVCACVRVRVSGCLLSVHMCALSVPAAQACMHTAETRHGGPILLCARHEPCIHA